MDPSLRVSSPFHNEVEGVDGVYDNAILSITSSSGKDAGGKDLGKPARSASGKTGTVNCTVCDTGCTTAHLPSDGIYMCASCHTLSKQKGIQHKYPTKTFKCCPMATTDLDGGVIRCARCGGWYHMQCMGIADPQLQNYVALSTTSWYCPEPSCSEKILMKHAKSNK